jgi:V/A-type H+-transporting ATPase subunit A
MVYLQQDAFDEVDSSCPIERQKTSFDLVCDLINRKYHFEDKSAVRDFFTRLTGLFRNLNYAAENSPTYVSYRKQIDDLATQASLPLVAAQGE